ncbi:MAG: hypothetical protein BZ136_09290 [Methanosphaera sp. rholeuAM74]|nr:MAG: hypothetical protein BZ136_09290 [Methanosphaera sp. rholeuAM74]
MEKYREIEEKLGKLCEKLLENMDVWQENMRNQGIFTEHEELLRSYESISDLVISFEEWINKIREEMKFLELTTLVSEEFQTQYKTVKAREQHQKILEHNSRVLLIQAKNYLEQLKVYKKIIEYRVELAIKIADQ